MIPLRFTYYSVNAKQKVHVTILSQFKHHFTGDDMYKVREDFADGWSLEHMYSHGAMIRLLSNKVEGN